MNKRLASTLNLQTRLAIGFALLAIITSGLTIFSLYLRAKSQIRNDTRQRLYDYVSLASREVDGDLHSTLTDPYMEGSPTYNKIRSVLQAIRDTGTDIHFVYTMRFAGDDLIFVVDAETNPEDVSHLGDVYYELDPSTKELLRNLNQPMVENLFYTDRWGTWMSGYAPVFNSKGQREAIMALDISVEDAVRSERNFLWLALAIFVALIPLSFIAGGLIGRWLTRPLITLTEEISQFSQGHKDQEIQIPELPELSLLAKTYKEMVSQIQTLVASLETTVEERTAELAERTRFLEAGTAVSQAAASILDTDQLISQVVDFIQDKFDLYYVGLFLVDEKGEWAILRAGTGQAGQSMLNRGHRIRIGMGMVGWSISNSQARVALEAGSDAVRLATQELPETRSEAAIPLRSRGQVIGALTVQSAQSGAFDESFLAVLQSMADQVAVAIDNARLFAESQSALAAAQRAYGQLTEQAWSKFLQSWANLGYYIDDKGMAPVGPGNGHLPGNVTEKDNELPTLMLPVMMRGQVLGNIVARKPAGAGAWQPDEVVLMESLVNQLGVALESARLFQETQRRAERERLAGQITARIRSTNDPQTILQTAVQELRQALQVQKAQVLLQVVPPVDNELKSNGGNGHEEQP